MPLTLQLQQLDIPPGQRLLIHDLNWEEFEQFLIELGEKRASRIAYSHPTLEIRMPLPKHERAKSFIGDMLTSSPPAASLWTGIPCLFKQYQITITA
ncbi:hypothetical protein [Roseofilum sp. Guam]|uniref:hypothetical protein n=1 Tax=Roseofilum sp. Guam TaxID=2821502 RepID=UPI00298E472F|nr:hypothetical protein [Roseofilum sp. Guam]